MSKNDSLKLPEITVTGAFTSICRVFLQNPYQVLPGKVGSTLRMQLAPPSTYGRGKHQPLKDCTLTLSPISIRIKSLNLKRKSNKE